MSRRYFGTDGIRGTANLHPMTADVALRLGLAAGRVFSTGADRRHVVLIGKDTRLSGYMLEPALTAGFISMGMDVVLIGPMPTPAVALLTQSMRADVGVMISASHNPFQDNGIKLFGPDGYKLSDAVEAQIEHLMDNGLADHLVPSARLGRAQRMEDETGRYIELVKATFPKDRSLDGLKVVVDCANGAAYRTAPRVLRELGAEVVAIGIHPDGTNINKDCGSQYPDQLRHTVLDHKADIGIALDGDADRIILCDENLNIIDGDQILGLIATAWKARGLLAGDTVVATVMSNLGLEKYLAGQGIALERTAVGDRYVVERMRAGGFTLGGEQSGHIVLGTHATTGDGLMAGLQVLAEMVASGKKASKLLNVFKPYPQKLRNLRLAHGADAQAMMAAETVQTAVALAEARFAGAGRVLLRKSGTEPLIRVMAEGEDAALVEQAITEICTAIDRAAAEA